MQTFGVVCAEFPVMAGRAGVSGDLGEPDAHESRLGHDTEGCGDEIEELFEIFAAAHAEEEVVAAVHAVQELQAGVRVLIAGEEFEAGDEGVYGLTVQTEAELLQTEVELLQMEMKLDLLEQKEIIIIMKQMKMKHL